MKPRSEDDAELDYSRYAADDLDQAVKIEKSERYKQRQEESGPSKLVLILITFFLILILAGIIVGYLFYLRVPTRPLFLSVPLEGYDPSWQVNPWASNDSKLIAQPFQRGSLDGNASMASVKIEFQQRDKFLNLLNWLASDKHQADADLRGDLINHPVVLHISALGSVYQDVPYIIPVDGQRHDPVNWTKPPADANWIRVEAVLEAFAKCKSTKGKLLLLDLAHPSHDAILGPLRNDLSFKIHQLLEKWEKEHKLDFPVIVSCGPGEFSLPNDARKCSGFAYYVAEGLRGHADGYNPKAELDRQVSVNELSQFVEARVARWAKQVHGVNQRPKSFGLKTKMARFILTYEPMEPPADAEPRPYAELHAQWWNVRKYFTENGPLMDYPLLRQKLTGGLLRAEDYWRHASDINWDRAVQFREIPATEWRSLIPPGQPNLVSLATTRTDAVLNELGAYRLGVMLRDQKEPPVEPYLRMLLAAKPPKEEDLEKAREAWEQKAASSPAQAAAALWEQGRRYTAWTESQLQKWAELAHGITQPPGQAGFSNYELILWRRLGSFRIRGIRGIPQVPANEVRQLLEAEHQLAQLLKLGPEGFVIVENRLLEAESRRVAAYQKYFRRELGSLRFDPPISDLPELYRSAALALQDWRAANAQLKRLIAAIHDQTGGVLARTGPSFTDWKDAITLAAELSDMLDASRVNRNFDASRAHELLARVNETIERLNLGPTYEAAVKRVKETAPRNDPLKAATILRLVRNSSADGDARRLVWQESQNDFAALVDTLRKSDTADNDVKSKTPSTLTKAPEPVEAVSEDADVRVRVDVANQLMVLAGYRQQDELAANIADIKAHPNSPDALEKFHRLADSIWFGELVQQVKDDIQSRRYFAVQRALWGLPVEVVRSVKATVWSDFRPAEMIFQEDERAFRKFVNILVANDRGVRVGDGLVDAEADAFFANLKLTFGSDPK